MANAYRAIDADVEFRTHLSRVRDIASNESIDPLWLSYLGKSYARSGFTRETRDMLELAMTRSNEEGQVDRAALAYLRGEVALANGENIEANEQFEMAYALQPNNYYLEALAHGYFVSGDYHAAEARFAQIGERKSLGWEAQDPWILSFYYLGRTREELGETDAAAEAYAQFLEIWEDGDDDLIALADARDRLRLLMGEH
jgi:tetratricopeptide (TPR) repeat protein